MQPQMKIDWQWPAALVFCVAFLVTGLLVYARILHPEVLFAYATWLAPGPWQLPPRDGQRKTLLPAPAPAYSSKEDVTEVDRRESYGNAD